MDIELKELQEGFDRLCYIVLEEHLNTIYMALRLEKPLLISGPAGAGKTEMAKSLSEILGAKLIRLQCHGGLDENKSLYEWNIQRQLLNIQIDDRSKNAENIEDDLFSMDYILQRPLLQAITQQEQVLLLVDEIDRADRDFEAFLLELLSDYQISIPEIGTIEAVKKPVVVITNSGERELSDALLRRCVFLYLDHPPIQSEACIIRARIPEILDTLNENIAMGVARTRDRGGNLGFNSAQAIDWARVLLMLSSDRFQQDYVAKSMEALASNQESLIAAENYYRHMPALSETEAGDTAGNGEIKN